MPLTYAYTSNDNIHQYLIMVYMNNVVVNYKFVWAGPYRVDSFLFKSFRDVFAKYFSGRQLGWGVGWGVIVHEVW